MKSVNSILEDLYALDPALREREQELIPLLTTLLTAKPEAEINADFAFQLRTTLMTMPNPVQTTPFFRRLSFVAVLGVLALAVAVPSAYYLSQNSAQTTTTDYAIAFSNLRDNAFGSLTANPQGAGFGGGSNPAPASKLNAESAATGDAILGTTEGMSSTRMIAPGEPYPYITTRYAYNFDGAITLPGNEGTVYRKASGIDLPETFATTNLGVIDLGRFRNLSTQYVTLRQDDVNGYTISVDTTYGNISININEGFWTDYYRKSNGAPLNNVPSESAITTTATKFLSEFGISTANYGTPRVDSATMVRIAQTATADGSEVYADEFIAVTWPLLIDGMEVLNSDGSGYGISVTVNLRENKVTSANILTTNVLEGSSYALESNTTRLEKLIARGGMYGWQPETADTTIDVAVGEPTLVYTVHSNYDQTTGKTTELFVPALKFNLTPPEGEVFYQSAMVIPLVSEILDSADAQQALYETYKTIDTPSVEPAVSEMLR